MASDDSNRNSELSDLLIKAALTDPKISAPGYDSSRVFALVSVLLNSPSAPTKKLLRSVNTAYVFHVAKDDGEERSFLVDLKKKGRVLLLNPGSKSPVKPDVSITVKDSDLVGLSTGKLNPQKLYAAKRIRVRGDIDRALKVEQVLSQARQKLEAIAAGIAQSGPAPKKESGRWASIKKEVKKDLNEVKAKL